MLDSNLKKKVLYYIEKNANGREIVLYGEDNSVQEMLNENGYAVKKIFTSRQELFKMNPEKFFDVEKLCSCEDKYYVILPFVLEDGGDAQRNTMERLGYSKYYDYIFVPDDEDIDLAFSNIRLNAKGRKVVSFGYDPNIENQFAQHGIEIKMRFSSNPTVLENPKLGCHNYDELKNQSSMFYVVFPFVNEDNGQWQRYIMKEYGFFENIDYCFAKLPRKVKNTLFEYKNNDVASRLYFPDRYKKTWYQYFSKSYHSSRTLSTDEVNNGIILPVRYTDDGSAHGGVCDCNFNFLAGHINEKNGKSGYVSTSYVVGEDEIEYIDETVVYGGIMFDHPGHLMIDCFAQRLWWYIKNPESKIKCAITVGWGDGSAKFVREFFELFGMPEEQIIYVKKPTKFKKIIIPEQSVYLSGLSIPNDFTDEYVEVFKQIKTRLKPSKIKKIYFTKSKTVKQDIIGENYFIDFYKKKGFAIINPEEYSLREKAEMMYGAEEFVSQIGTNTMYAIFCQPTVKMKIISRVNSYSVMLPVQKVINEATGITDFYCVDVSLNFLHKNYTWGISVIGVTDSFKSFVKDVYKEKIDITKEDSLKENLYDYLKRFSEYYTTQKLFDGIKNQKMISILQNMSEIFLDKDFDVCGLNITTNEDIAIKDLKSSNCRIEILTKIIVDLTNNNNFLKYIKEHDFKSVSLLCNDNKLEKIFDIIFKFCNIEKIFSSNKIKCHELTDEEWTNCKKADLILGFNDKKIDPGMRDGIKAFDINKILQVNGEKNKTLNYSCCLKEVAQLQEHLSAILKKLDINQTILNKMDRIYMLIEDNQKQSAQLYIDNQEFRKTMSEYISKESQFELEVDQLKNKNFALLAQNEQLSSNLAEASMNLAKMRQKISCLEQERDSLKSCIYEMENSRSWRYTRIFRKNKKDEEI